MNLKIALSNEQVQENIKNSIFNGNEEESKTALRQVIRFVDDENDKYINSDPKDTLIEPAPTSIRTSTAINGQEAVLETNLYKKEMYLLETTAFDKNENTLGRYLQLMEDNGAIVNPDDDVWGTIDWVPIEDENTYLDKWAKDRKEKDSSGKKVSKEINEFAKDNIKKANEL